ARGLGVVGAVLGVGFRHRAKRWPPSCALVRFHRFYSTAGGVDRDRGPGWPKSGSSRGSSGWPARPGGGRLEFMSTVVELRRVSKVYGAGPARVQALCDVDLSVAAGAMVAGLGQSGSGKRTLLSIAGSLGDPTSGEVLVGGTSLTTMSRSHRARLRRRSVGYVFQDFNLLPGLTAAENVALPLELDGQSPRKARSVGADALEELGLGEKAARLPDELSGGERQRVAIARAVVGERRLILADEPTGALGA